MANEMPHLEDNGLHLGEKVETTCETRCLFLKGLVLA